MRLLIVLILLPFITHGQIVRTHPYYRPTAVSCSYLLDQYSGAAAAYSLRQLDCDYAGSAIRVRRSSDNTEQDIGFVNGNLDTASLKTFVGTGGSDDGFVVTWYDQTGNSRNMTQSTSGNQAKIMDNGVIYRRSSLPIVYHTGNSNYYRCTGLSISATSHSWFSVFIPENSAQYARIFSMLRNGDTHDYQYVVPMLQQSVTNQSMIQYISGGDRNPITYSGTNLNLGNVIATGSAVTHTYNNGTPSSYTFSFSATISEYTIAFNPGETNKSFTGYFAELVIYNADKTSDKSSINGNINTYYSIY